MADSITHTHHQVPSPAHHPLQGDKPVHHGIYVPVVGKFSISLVWALLWMAFSIYIAQDWLHDLGQVVGIVPAHLIIWGIAIIPGFMNAFLVAGLLLDRRPAVQHPEMALPGITVLVAAYNEADNIAATLDTREADPQARLRELTDGDLPTAVFDATGNPQSFSA